MSKAPKTAPKSAEPEKLYRYAVRVIEAGKSVAFNTKAKTLTELRNSIDSSPTPRIIFNTEEYGPALVHRDHIIIITREPDLPA